MVASITQRKEVVHQEEPMDEKTSNNSQEERMMDATIAVSKVILLENVDCQGGALKEM